MCRNLSAGKFSCTWGRVMPCCVRTIVDWESLQVAVNRGLVDATLLPRDWQLMLTGTTHTLQHFSRHPHLSAAGDDDWKKLLFTLDAVRSDDPLSRRKEVPEQIEQKLCWEAQRRSPQIMGEREGMMTKLESEGRVMWWACCFACLHS